MFAEGMVFATNTLPGDESKFEKVDSSGSSSSSESSSDADSFEAADLKKSKLSNMKKVDRTSGIPQGSDYEPFLNADRDLNGGKKKKKGSKESLLVGMEF